MSRFGGKQAGTIESNAAVHSGNLWPQTSAAMAPSAAASQSIDRFGITPAPCLSIQRVPHPDVRAVMRLCASPWLELPAGDGGRKARIILKAQNLSGVPRHLAAAVFRVRGLFQPVFALKSHGADTVHWNGHSGIPVSWSAGWLQARRMRKLDGSSPCHG